MWLANSNNEHIRFFSILNWGSYLKLLFQFLYLGHLRVYAISSLIGDPNFLTLNFRPICCKRACFLLGAHTDHSRSSTASSKVFCVSNITSNGMQMYLLLWEPASPKCLPDESVSHLWSWKSMKELMRLVNSGLGSAGSKHRPLFQRVGQWESQRTRIAAWRNSRVKEKAFVLREKPPQHF